MLSGHWWESRFIICCDVITWTQPSWQPSEEGRGTCQQPCDYKKRLGNLWRESSMMIQSNARAQAQHQLSAQQWRRLSTRRQPSDEGGSAPAVSPVMEEAWNSPVIMRRVGRSVTRVLVDDAIGPAGPASWQPWWKWAQHLLTALNYLARLWGMWWKVMQWKGFVRVEYSYLLWQTNDYDKLSYLANPTVLYTINTNSIVSTVITVNTVITTILHSECSCYY